MKLKQLTSTFLLGLLVQLCAIGQNTNEVIRLNSPNGDLAFQFYQKPLDQGKTQMYYTVQFCDKEVILESELGILVDNKLFESALAIENDTCALWCENLELMSVDYDTVWNEWKPVYGERSLVKDNYNQMTLHFSKYGELSELSEGHQGTHYDKRRSYEMDIVVRAYNEGIAFRYVFPEAKNGLFVHIEGEQTSFAFEEGTMSYYERWAQGPFSYLSLNEWPDECERPLTLTLKNGLFVSLLEAQMIDYSRGKFQMDTEKPNAIKVKMYDKVDVITPYETPWRCVMVAEKAGQLLENNDIVLNLNKPNELKTISWIKPGKVIRSNLSNKDAIECIDFAAERNLQYVHLDAGWYGPEMKVASDATTIGENRDIDMSYLVDYAAKKGVGIFVYINQRALYKNLDEVFAKCREWGIKGVKFGFVQIGSNRWTTWMHDAVKKAAEYNLLVDIHDEYRPTGFSRTYPNLMTQEGIRGNEEMPDATHNTILPFTRFLAGAGDYTICYYNNRIKTTHAHQLALSVVYYSPIQFLYWYDKPTLYKGEQEIEFFDKVKTVWEDTKVINGEIGKYITVARKSDNEWFVGAIANNDGQSVQIPLDFLEENEKYEATIFYDDPKMDSRTKVNRKVKKVSNGDILKFDLLPSGGVAVIFSKIDK